MHRYPGSFLVLGAFYPPLSASPTFFEFDEMDPTARTTIPTKTVDPEPDLGPTLFTE
jgi:hypothetical protein